WAISSGGSGKSKSSTVNDMGRNPKEGNKNGLPSGKPFCNYWCPGPDSNRHTFRRRILNPLRLPIPPPGQSEGGLSTNHFFGSSVSEQGNDLARALATSMAVVVVAFGGWRSRWASTERTRRGERSASSLGRQKALSRTPTLSAR